MHSCHIQVKQFGIWPIFHSNNGQILKTECEKTYIKDRKEKTQLIAILNQLCHKLLPIFDWYIPTV